MPHKAQPIERLSLHKNIESRYCIPILE